MFIVRWSDKNNADEYINCKQMFDNFEDALLFYKYLVFEAEDCKDKELICIE